MQHYSIATDDRRALALARWGVTAFFFVRLLGVNAVEQTGGGRKRGAR